VVVNVSRCRELVEEEMGKVLGEGRGFEVAFEERPLGVLGTLRRLCATMNGGKPGGCWLVSNTDMITDLDPSGLLEHHLQHDLDWTAATGEMPESGIRYSPLLVSDDDAMRFGVDTGRERHYLGMSVLGSRTLRLLARSSNHGGLFSDLAASAAGSGLRLGAFESEASWLDMGDIRTLRKSLLSQGSYVSDSATIGDGAVLSGVNYVGACCLIGPGASLENSVMLEGSELGAGVVVSETIVPWGTRIGK
jgi:NDP-sugar pyrophosphorylase family protein